MTAFIGRREFITLLGGVAAAWPLVARAQQPERMRRVGVFMNMAADDPDVRPASQPSDKVCRNWAGSMAATCASRFAGPEAMPTHSQICSGIGRARGRMLFWLLAATQWPRCNKSTRTVPIVFAAGDRPGRRRLCREHGAAGRQFHRICAFEYAIGAKWLELLKEIAPGCDASGGSAGPHLAAGIGQFAAIQAVAPIGMELSASLVHDAGAIEPAVAAFARGSNGGLIVTASPFATNHPRCNHRVGGPVQAARSLSFPLFVRAA